MAAPEDSPTARAGAPGRPPGPTEIVVVLGGPITRADAPRLCERLRALLRGTGADEVVCDVSGVADPGVAAVEALVRMQLTARRLGHRIRLRRACGELRELLALTGLSRVLPLEERTRGFEPVGQAEHREQALGVEEGVEPDDLPR
ncbi:anti-anti-sigma regulatory factor [Spinactinospora alkalitolerans]|uniref:Anti-anti-sigma regulatory factor n=1 Tax=Spinactinospora alkalitolerans TaxID=687207 RepID=A0A852TZE2_9ACTN|nr:STAS domain-containing protein [Spinactinospora alkalitolerans]NYE48412.1 anti-anti-sigma regulatory factor [Spinactinospora alkalitolerans]